MILSFTDFSSSFPAFASEKEWKESVDYGKRWNVEIYFSGLKRTMGEVIKAVRPDYIAQEIALKVQYYNMLREVTHAY